eukprot:Rhum_TRINITY_DN15264_c16_g1::Rhum_TRINITY_DN15264_c16_g1_i1::g.149286::m.149286
MQPMYCPGNTGDSTLSGYGSGTFAWCFRCARHRKDSPTRDFSVRADARWDAPCFWRVTLDWLCTASDRHCERHPTSSDTDVSAAPPCSANPVCSAHSVACAGLTRTRSARSSATMFLLRADRPRRNRARSSASVHDVMNSGSDTSLVTACIDDGWNGGSAAPPAPPLGRNPCWLGLYGPTAVLTRSSIWLKSDPDSTPAPPPPPPTPTPPPTPAPPLPTPTATASPTAAGAGDAVWRDAAALSQADDAAAMAAIESLEVEGRRLTACCTELATNCCGAWKELPSGTCHPCVTSRTRILDCEPRSSTSYGTGTPSALPMRFNAKHSTPMPADSFVSEKA